MKTAPVPDKVKKLRIAMMCSSSYTSPPPAGVIFAPIYLGVTLAEGLSKRGHEVTFYAPRGSKIKGSKLKTANLRPLKQSPHPKIYKLSNTPLKALQTSILMDQFLMSELFKDALESKFDVIHLHNFDYAMGFARMVQNTPVIYSLHDPANQIREEMYKLYKSPNQFFVSPSKSQKIASKYLNHLDVVYHGIDTGKFEFSPIHKDYLLYAGRIIPSKGPDIAVQAALKSKQKLYICGQPNSSPYWDKEIKPYLGKQIIYKGALSPDQLVPYFKYAKALLFPTQANETFGLAMAEAMSCGTPVIGMNNGAVSEVIKHGKTGFVVKNLKEMVAAISKIDSIDRNTCRQHIINNFSQDKMISGYEKIFHQVANNS